MPIRRLESPGATVIMFLMCACPSTKPKPLQAWIDGRIIPATSPALPVFDQSYLSGMGAFETIRAESGEPLFLEAHHERLVASAACFGLEVPGVESLRSGIRKLLAGQDFALARIRVTISGAIDPDGVPFRFGGNTRTTILAFPLKPERAAAIRLVTAPHRADPASPLASHKCTSYALHALAMHHARARGAHEALVLDQEDHVSGGATSNLFWVGKGRVHTPETSCGCRPGVTRGRVIRACGRLGIPCDIVFAKVAELFAADEVFTTSSIRGIRRVLSLDGKRLNGGGILTKRIRAALRSGD